MSTARNMLFISHATPENNEVARWLALRLAAEGYPVWCDLTKLLGGEPFWKEIETAIRDRTCKFIFLLSKESNEKQGTRDELEVASTVRKLVDDDRFIIPLRVDDMDFSKANIRIHGLNIIDFTANWMVGFQKLVERLQDDKVPTDERFDKDSVSVWWRHYFAQNEGVTQQDDLYLSNEFAINRMPDQIQIIGLQRQPQGELSPVDSPYPIAAHKRFLVSFGEPRDLLPFIEKHKLHFNEGANPCPLADFLQWGLPHVIPPRVARNLVQHLLNQAIRKFAFTRGLIEYQMANHRSFSWFPKGLLQADKLSFKAHDERQVRRNLVGFSNCTARDGSVYIRNWHFGVEMAPHLGRSPYVNILPHVCFSVDGVPYESPKKQHSLRRSQCRSWYNDDWRDRILGAMFHLADGQAELTVPVSPDGSFSIAAFPAEWTSPVNYRRVSDKDETIESIPDADDRFDDEIEEEDDE